jgi:hypothetical protein
MQKILDIMGISIDWKTGIMGNSTWFGREVIGCALN